MRDHTTRGNLSLEPPLVVFGIGFGLFQRACQKAIRSQVLATAILDRLLHRSHVVNVKGRSYRLKDLEKRLQ